MKCNEHVPARQDIAVRHFWCTPAPASQAILHIETFFPASSKTASRNSTPNRLKFAYHHIKKFILIKVNNQTFTHTQEATF